MRPPCDRRRSTDARVTRRRITHHRPEWCRDGGDNRDKRAPHRGGVGWRRRAEINDCSDEADRLTMSCDARRVIFTMLRVTPVTANDGMRARSDGDATASDAVEISARDRHQPIRIRWRMRLRVIR